MGSCEGGSVDAWVRMGKRGAERSGEWRARILQLSGRNTPSVSYRCGRLASKAGVFSGPKILRLSPGTDRVVWGTASTVEVAGVVRRVLRDHTVSTVSRIDPLSTQSTFSHPDTTLSPLPAVNACETAGPDSNNADIRHSLYLRISLSR